MTITKGVEIWLLHEQGTGSVANRMLMCAKFCQRSLVLTIYLKFKMAASFWLTRHEAPFAAFDAEFERNGYVF